MTSPRIDIYDDIEKYLLNKYTSFKEKTEIIGAIAGAKFLYNPDCLRQHTMNDWYTSFKTIENGLKVANIDLQQDIKDEITNFVNVQQVYVDYIKYAFVAIVVIFCIVYSL